MGLGVKKPVCEQCRKPMSYVQNRKLNGKPKQIYITLCPDVSPKALHGIFGMSLKLNRQLNDNDSRWLRNCTGAKVHASTRFSLAELGCEVSYPSNSPFAFAIRSDPYAI